MNILIVDDHPLVCNGIKNILHSEKGFKNILDANNIDTALELMSSMNFNLVLVDIRLKDQNGIDFVTSAKTNHPDCKFVIISSSSDSLDFEHALKAGVDGYILKDAFPEDIIYALKTVLRRRKYFDPVFVTELNEHVNQNEDRLDEFKALSPREVEIMECLSKGMSNRDISKTLYISENTVKKHISSILSKLGLKNRTQAALYMSRKLGKNMQ